MAVQPDILFSACPHDCPSTCALEVERLDERSIGKVRGARDNSYTAGVICSKVARYAERIHHPDRLTTPLRRIGDQGCRDAFEPVSWDDALDITAESLLQAEQRHGPEAVWPYFYAGTMGLVMRDGINRLRHVKRYSGQHSTICVTLAWNGFVAGTGKLAGSDPREMARSDLVVIWGTNAAATQINVMTHALAARMVEAAIARAKELGVKQNVAVVDDGGNLKAFARMDGAPLLGIEGSQRKAYTALFGFGTADFYNAIKDNPALLVGLSHFEGVTVVGGGLPITIDGEVVGGIGVGGGTVEQDISCAEAGLRVLGE